MFKRKKEKPAAKSLSEVLGKCPECNNGLILPHKSGDYFICSRRLADGTCNFTISRDCLKKFGKARISNKGMSLLLNDATLYFYDFLHPSTAEPLNCLCQIYLKWKPHNRTGVEKYFVHVEIFWDEPV